MCTNDITVLAVFCWSTENESKRRTNGYKVYNYKVAACVYLTYTIVFYVC